MKPKTSKPKAVKPTPPEPTLTANALTAELLLQLPALFPCRLWRQNVILARAKRGLVRSLPNGVPDLTGILWPGFRLDIEVKVGRDVLSEQQKRYRDMAQHLGGIYIVARTVEGCISQIQASMRAIQASGLRPPVPPGAPLATDGIEWSPEAGVGNA